jgi:SAM-dependent methyltransferase
MKIENKEFWEREDIIHSQDKTVGNTSSYEVYLYEKTKKYFEDLHVTINSAKIFGCGTGREIKGLLKYLSINHILATDISQNMITKAKVNIQSWGLEDKVVLKVEDASKFSHEKDSFELVTLMNCMLTYVHKKEDRYKIFETAHTILKPKGCLIGAVHNQVGTPQKTIYFLIRRILKRVLKNEPGARTTGFYGFDVKGYYFTKNDLRRHLEDNGFTNIEIKSLTDYFKEINVKYNRLKGMNNLIFFATKP